MIVKTAFSGGYKRLRSHCQSEDQGLVCEPAPTLSWTFPMKLVRMSVQV